MVAEKEQILVNESLANSQNLSTVIHELRTPLTSIVGYADRLLVRQDNVGQLNERQQRYVTAISKSSHRLEDLINDLLDISRIEAGKLEITLIELEVGKEIEELVQVMQTQFGEKQISIVLDIPSSLRPVYADANRFTQVVKNLLSNACKYSPVGAEVTVSAIEVAEFVQIDVSDSGIGISESSQSDLFTKFFRGDNTAARTESGAGLGLFIARQLIGAQGGEIWAYSEEGVGSTFSIALPCANVDNFHPNTPAKYTC